jgi:hypothetical protein
MEAIAAPVLAGMGQEFRPPSDHVGVGGGTKPERRYLHAPRQRLAAPQPAGSLFEGGDSSGFGLERPQMVNRHNKLRALAGL